MRPLLLGALAVVTAGILWLAWPTESGVRAGARDRPQADATERRDDPRSDGAETTDGFATDSTGAARTPAVRREMKPPIPQKPRGKTGVYRPPSPATDEKQKQDKPARARRAGAREIPGMAKRVPATQQPDLRATLQAIEAIDAPADVVGRSPSFVEFTTDRFTGTLPEGASTRTPSQPSDILVTAYFATRNLGATVQRCTFSWWAEGDEDPFRTATVFVNRKWLHQVDTLELAVDAWPAGTYHVLVHAVAAEPELVAAGSFEIRAPVVFSLSGLEVVLDDQVVGASCVVDPEVETTLTLRFASVAAAGRRVRVRVIDGAGGSVWAKEVTLESPGHEPKVEQFAVTRKWAPGHYACAVAEATELQRIEFTIKPPPRETPAKD